MKVKPTLHGPQCLRNSLFETSCREIYLPTAESDTRAADSKRSCSTRKGVRIPTARSLVCFLSPHLKENKEYPNALDSYRGSFAVGCAVRRRQLSRNRNGRFPRRRRRRRVPTTSKLNRRRWERGIGMTFECSQALCMQAETRSSHQFTLHAPRLVASSWLSPHDLLPSLHAARYEVHHHGKGPCIAAFANARTGSQVRLCYVTQSLSIFIVISILLSEFLQVSISLERCCSTIAD